jgi:hypothetical protein
MAENLAWHAPYGPADRLGWRGRSISWATRALAACPAGGGLLADSCIGRDGRTGFWPLLPFGEGAAPNLANRTRYEGCPV